MDYDVRCLGCDVVLGHVKGANPWGQDPVLKKRFSFTSGWCARASCIEKKKASEAASKTPPPTRQEIEAAVMAVSRGTPKITLK